MFHVIALLLFPSAVFGRTRNLLDIDVTASLCETPYKVHNVVAYGGFGMIYKATNLKTNQFVAIKELGATTTRRNELLARELEILAIATKSPYMVHMECHEYAEETKKTYIVMEFCENGDLTQYLRYLQVTTGRGMSEETVRDFLRQLTHGLQFLHEHHIIHRDLKPGNILLKNNNQTLKIADFGLSRIVPPLTRVHSYVGSPAYTAPEIKRGQAYTDAVDIWSIGILLYEMFYLKRPRVVKAQFDFPDNVQISDEMKSFITDCIQYEDQRMEYNEFLKRVQVQLL